VSTTPSGDRTLVSIAAMPPTPARPPLPSISAR
jgi:hypothetical protein